MNKYNKPSRLESVDVIRGFAIFLILFTHIFRLSIDNWASNRFQLIDEFASYYSVPLFFFIVGYSLVLSIESKERKGYSKKEIDNYIIVRCIAILIVSQINKLFAIGLDNWWHWGALQIIAVCSFITYILIKQSRINRIVLIIIIILTSFLLEPYYYLYHYQGEWSLQGFLLGFIFSGGLPLLPWLSYFILGTLIANINQDKILYKISLASILIAFSSIIVWYYVPNLTISKYPASLVYNIFFLNATVILFVLLRWLIDVRKLVKKIYYPFLIFGRYPFTIYVSQTFIIYPLIKLSQTYCDYPNNIIGFIAFIAILIIMLSIIGYFWEKYNFKYSIEWFVKKVSYIPLEANH